jgi:hypothetical protein
MPARVRSHRKPGFEELPAGFGCGRFESDVSTMEDMIDPDPFGISLFQQEKYQHLVNKLGRFRRTGVSLRSRLDRINIYHCQNIYLEYL